ncbi:uncharacterized protein LOC105398629 isoform X2 [Plutella xylostella]|uniref:uncharacterized protein LOC105398629 isoform X2 n=1 Tax=Plutella xylostella TaxID=51655 RepID=UPI002032A1FA|nr:uncharacterized protein LOC105398629 isoform X2 [Plutella xylostella]
MSKVLTALGGALPDERPLLSIQIVESVAKCPAGYFPVNRTYDEDSDAGLLKQNGLFGKKPSHYICLSKSEGVPGYVMDGLVVVGEREAAPPGYSVCGRAGKRRICTRVSRLAAAPAAPPVTDVIVCSKMRQAPQGFILAGEINGKVVCYKVSGGSAEVSPTHTQNDYENVCNNITPEANRSSISALYREFKQCWHRNDRLRAVPDRPPKLSPLINDLNNLNLKQSAPAYPNIDEFTTSHDYEALSPSYNINKPSRPAPRPPPVMSPALSSPGPVSPTPPGGRRKGPAPLPRQASNYLTLGGYNALEGVPFVLNPKLMGMPAAELMQIPVIKQRTNFDLERDYSYNFAVERQT